MRLFFISAMLSTSLYQAHRSEITHTNVFVEQVFNPTSGPLTNNPKSTPFLQETTLNNIPVQNYSRFENSSKTLNMSILNMSDTSEAFSAMMYIVIVLGFYSTSIVILLVRYSHQERHDARYTYYYKEFVKREDFHKKQILARQRSLSGTELSHASV